MKAREANTEDYFLEILLTYRLIFGQDERSYKAFSKLAPSSDENRGRAAWESNWDNDPMLHLLCGKSSMDPDVRKIYEEVGANQPVSHYNPHTEFPYLGSRLVELQQFIKQHQPQNLKDLLTDKRDVASWFNLSNTLIILLFTTFTIVLMIVSVAFQIWQVRLAQQQIYLAELQLVQTPPA